MTITVRDVAIACLCAVIVNESTDRAYADLIDFNLVVGGTLDAGNGVQGRTAVVGNLIGQSSSYGTGLTPAANSAISIQSSSAAVSPRRE